MLWLKKFWLLLTDVIGEVEGDGDGGSGDPEGQSSGTDDGAKGDGATTPKYGDFGDSPTVDQIFEAYNLKSKEIEGFGKQIDDYKGKLTANQKNISAIRKALEGSGLKVLQDDSGNVQLTVAEEKKERAKRFTDDHLKQLSRHFQGSTDGAREFLKLISDAVADEREARLEEYEKGYESKFDSFYNSRLQKRAKFIHEKNEAMSTAKVLFPNVYDKNADGTENPDFNEKFYELATEIYEGDETLSKSSEGELKAMIKAAKELGISVSSKAILEGAKKEGYKQGKEGKKILGKVDSGGKGSGGIPKKLSKEAFDKLSNEEKEKYKKQSIGLTA